MNKYKGETYQIPLEQGGFCHNKNIDTISPVSHVHPSRNIWLNEGGIRKRGGTTLVDTYAMWDIGTPDFEGEGLDDMTAAGTYTGITAKTYKVQVDAEDGIKTSTLNAGGSGYAANDTFTVDGGDPLATGKVLTVNSGAVVTFSILTYGAGYSVADAVETTKTSGSGTGLKINVTVLHDTFKWSDDGGSTWDATLVAMTGAAQTLNTGFTVTFAAITGHTIDEYWTVAVTIPDVTGLFDFILANTNQFIVRATSNGDLWKDEDSTIKTGWTADKKVHIMQWGDEVFFCNGANIPTVWNGVAAGTTDLTAGVKAQGTITMSGVAVGDETFVIDDQTFTWKAERGEAGQVTIGANAAAAVTNIVAAITADLDTVTAADGAGDTVVVTAASYGTAGNSIVFTEDSTNMAVNGEGTLGTTTAGVDDQIPSDWTGTNYPQQMVQHGRGNSIRNWALGCPSTPKTIYVTPSGEPKNFGDADVLTFNIQTGDGTGIVGGIDFGDRLILFSKNKSFVVDDESTDSDNWGYAESQWIGGAATHRLIVRTPNDIVCMMENGEIYSVTAAENYGDYKAASLTRPSYMHEWIKTYINLAYIADFHAVYDPVIRAVKFFMVRTGETEVDTCLAYFIDRTPDKAWVVLGNENFESGYSALCSAVVRESAGVYKIYTGSYSGQVWKLGEANRNDNSQAYVARIRTPDMGFDNVRESKRYDRIKIISVSEGSCDATITWWIDGALVDDEVLDFAVDGGILGSFILGTSILGGPNILENSVRVGDIGKRIQVEAKSATADEDFFLSQFLIDFLPTGKRA